MMFPIEIWEHIFLYIDPVVLTRLKTVCKLWKNIIDKILLENDHWYKKCNTDIPQHLLSSLCTKLDPNQYYTEFHEKQDAIMWMAMYRLWTKCVNLTKYDMALDYIEPVPKHRMTEKITCLSTSGTLLASGTSEGYIYIYDMSTLKGPPIYKADHMEYVRNIQFLRNETNIFLVATSINNHVKFWDIKLKKLIYKQRGKLISTSYGYCYTAMNNVMAIEGSIPRRLYQLDIDNIVAIEADNNKVSFFTDGGHYGQLCMKEEGTQYSLLHHVKPPEMKIRRFYIFKPNIAVFITPCGTLGISVGDGCWKTRNVLGVTGGTPTSVLIYANLLILGLDTGSVYICYVDNFENWDLNTENSKRITPDRTAVISLDIFIHLEEYLAIAYSKRVYTVKFI